LLTLLAADECRLLLSRSTLELNRTLGLVLLDLDLDRRRRRSFSISRSSSRLMLLLAAANFGLSDRLSRGHLRRRPDDDADGGRTNLTVS
jgi:hypothetical protein